MLGLVNNQAVSVEPVLDLPQRYELRVAKPDSRGRGRLYLYLDGQIVDFGRTFYKMEGEAILNHTSGEFTVSKGAKPTFRCVFAGQHLDIQL